MGEIVGGYSPYSLYSSHNEGNASEWDDTAVIMRRRDSGLLKALVA